jgi:aspartyl-tRNA(Asn)/glutamyl-tRNA(Gln) amidotransferase subunit B
MKTYTPTIGIEVHAELKTNTKMFCNSKNDPHTSIPNTHVCPICMGHPGTLPVANKKAIEHVIKVGIAVGGTIATYTEFDRKNYFYPDIPKGYQISQYAYPLVTGGELNGVTITRIHLEEDTARSLHDSSEGSHIDYNRAGVPLMELVTEPVIHDAKTAGRFARELQLLLRTLRVSDANMEKGEMRVEVNISVSDTHIYGTKVEVKNLNSFKSVESAIEYEIKRQIDLLRKGEVVTQETRGWDEVKGKTFSQRIKESAHDYRYFPDPDIPKIDIARDETISLSRIHESMPILPEKKREKYSNLGLSREQIESIISDMDTDIFFTTVISHVGDNTTLIKLFANYIVTDIFPILTKTKKTFAHAHSDTFVALIQMIVDKKITSRVAKDMLEKVVFDGIDPEKYAHEHTLLQTDTVDTLLPLVKEIIANNQSVVEEFRAGKENSIQYLVGQGMKISKGSVNPKILMDMLRAEIDL